MRFRTSLAIVLALAPVARADESKQCIEYKIVEGTEDVYGAPEAEKPKAYARWQTACEEWKQKVRGFNIANQVIAAGCSRPKREKSDDGWVYFGTGLYKIRVRLSEPAVEPPK